MTEHSYQKQRRARERTALLKRQVVFGLVAGWLALLLGLYNYYFTLRANDLVWQSVAWLGVVLLVLAVIWPAALAFPARMVNAIGSRLFLLVMQVFLGVIYYLILWPLGAWYRRGVSEIHYTVWRDKAPLVEHGWSPKHVSNKDLGVDALGGKKAFLLIPFEVLGHFARHGHYLVIPILIVMLVLGFILFFLQTSALAPMIYTLF